MKNNNNINNNNQNTAFAKHTANHKIQLNTTVLKIKKLYDGHLGSDLHDKSN